MRQTEDPSPLPEIDDEGIVDSHVHLLPDELARKVRTFFSEQIHPHLAYPLEHGTILDALAAAGVREVWSLPYAHRPGVASGLNVASSQLVRTYSEHTVRVLGGATIHPDDLEPEALLAEAFEEYRLSVLKLHCSVGDFRPDALALDRTWGFVSERAIPVVVHLGHAVSGHTDASDLDPISNVAARYPEAVIVIAHCGHRAGELVLDLLERFPNVYADLTPVVADLVTLPPDRVEQLAHKLLFGSDAPNVALPVEASLAHVRGLELSAPAARQVLGGTARRLIRQRRIG